MAPGTPGRKDLRKLQIGYEVTAGTAVPATVIYRAPVNSIVDESEVVEIDEQVGILGGTDRTHMPKLLASYELAEHDATFEQFPHIMAAAWGSACNVAGVVDGAGASGYVYTATIPTTTKPTPRALTIEAGDDYEVEEMEYAVITEHKISGAAGEALKASAKFSGRQITKSAFTALASIPIVEVIDFSTGKLYLDKNLHSAPGTVGTTQVSKQLLKAELTIKTKWILKYTADGARYFTQAIYTRQEVTGSITLEHDEATTGAAGGARYAMRNREPWLLRLQFTGSVYATPGAGGLNTSHKTLRIDLPIFYTKVSALDDEDGNDILTFDFKAKYNADYAKAGEIKCTNEITDISV
jgi:hypothetical protein